MEIRVNSLYYIQGVSISNKIKKEKGSKCIVYGHMDDKLVNEYLEYAIANNTMNLNMLSRNERLDRCREAFCYYTKMGILVDIENEINIDADIKEFIFDENISQNLTPVPSKDNKDIFYCITKDGYKYIAYGRNFDKYIEEQKIESNETDVLSNILLDVLSINKNIDIKRLQRRFFYKNIPISILNATCEMKFCNEKQNIDFNKIEKCRLGLYINKDLLCKSFGFNTETPYMRFISFWITLEIFIKEYFDSIENRKIYCMVKKYSSNERKYISNTEHVMYNKNILRLSSKIIESNSRDIKNYKNNTLRDKIIICMLASHNKIDIKILNDFIEIYDIRNSIHTSVNEKEKGNIEKIYNVLSYFLKD